MKKVWLWTIERINYLLVYKITAHWNGPNNENSYYYNATIRYEHTTVLINISSSSTNPTNGNRTSPPKKDKLRSTQRSGCSSRSATEAKQCFTPPTDNILVEKEMIQARVVMVVMVVMLATLTRQM